jgi:hypothetical protein
MQRLYMRYLCIQRLYVRRFGIQCIFDDDYSMDVIGHNNKFVD